MNNVAIAAEESKAESTIHVIEHADSELYKVGMYSTAAFAALLGGWGLFCLSSAILGNGPLDILKSLFQAVAGV